MRNLKLILILTLILSCFTIFFEKQNVADASLFCNEEYYDKFFVLCDEFDWLTFDIYKIIKVECIKNDYKLIKHPVAFVCSLIKNESADYCKGDLDYMLKVRSYAGAIGIMQIMPKYHLRKNETKKDLEDPKINIKKGCRYLKSCERLSKGSIRNMLKNYNSGYYSKFYNDPYIRRITNKYKQVLKLMNEAGVS